MIKRAFSWSERSILIALVLFALALRVTLMLHYRTYIFPGDDQSWEYGYEAGRIAAAIARGDGFSSPFPQPSGPTAWLAPVYPYLVAAVFKIFGIYSRSSAIVIFLLQSLFASLTAVLAYYISRRLFSSVKSARLAALLLAVYPASIWFSINYIWDDALLALSLAATMLLLLRLPKIPGPKSAAVAGLLMGFTLLIGPAVLSFYVPALAYIAWRARADKRRALRFVAITGAAAGLVLLPWLIRNYVIFGQAGLLKSGFGVELRIGNNPEATGMFTQAHGKLLHPSLVPEEFARYVRMGEVQYNRYCYEEAMAFIRANPWRFLRLCLRRLGYFWLKDWEEMKAWLENRNQGLSRALALKQLSYMGPLPFLVIGLFTAWRRRQDVALCLLLFLMFPLVYYVTHVSAKYRYYIDPMILVVASYGLCTVVDTLYDRAQRKLKGPKGKTGWDYSATKTRRY